MDDAGALAGTFAEAAQGEAMPRIAAYCDLSAQLAEQVAEFVRKRASLHASFAKQLADLAANAQKQLAALDPLAQTQLYQTWTHTLECALLSWRGFSHALALWTRADLSFAQSPASLSPSGPSWVPGTALLRFVPNRWFVFLPSLVLQDDGGRGSIAQGACELHHKRRNRAASDGVQPQAHPAQGALRRSRVSR
eukprot:m.126483 g.126483  ORF g.126483 m.126483 type:complete len:194 (-) comp9707_c0_seq3:4019-4600(-)